MFDIYVKDGDKIRYVLGTEGSNTLAVIGINPSTATDEKSDRTISRMSNYLQKYGFDSFKMLNIYPQRATDPNGLAAEINENIHKQNMTKINSAVKGCTAILCAWGNLIFKRPYLPQCLNDMADIIEKAQIPTYCLGLTKAGNPRHPLARIKTPEQLTKFDVKNYIENVVNV